MTLADEGYLSPGQMAELPGVPSKARLALGPVAVIECAEEIPCDPCQDACPSDAIHVGEPLTNLPILNEEACIGCGLCIAACPGQAIFIVDVTYAEGEATVSLPYEYRPLPEKGESVDALSRAGEAVCEGRVVRVQNQRKDDHTPVITVAVEGQRAMEVRNIRLRREGA